MPLVDLPTELLQDIIWHLDDEASIFSIANTCQMLFDLSIDYLYLFNAKNNNADACDWASSHGRTDTLKKALSLGIHIGNDKRLYDVVNNGNLEALRLFIDSDANGWVADGLGRFDISGISLLGLVSERGDLPMLQTLLMVCSVDEASRAIHVAVAAGHFNVVLALLEKGVEVSTPDASGHTPLHIAAINEHNLIVRLILAWGGSIDAQDNRHRTALHIASKMGNVNIINSLLEHGAEMEIGDYSGRTALLHAVDQNQPQAAQVLLDQGAEIGSFTVDGLETTPLHLACMESCSTEVIEMLIERRAYMYATDDCGRTPLSLAVQADEFENVKALFAKGAQVDERDDGPGAKPLLSLAASNGNVEMAKLLLFHGADLNCTDNRGCTALMSAAFDGHATMVSFLLEKGACSRLLSKSKWTALDAAALRGHVGVGKVLLDQMTCDGTVNSIGRNTATQTASTGGHIEFVKLLLRYWPDALVNQGPNGRLPIHSAADNGQVDLLKFFFTHPGPGPGIDCRDMVGRTPLFLAARSGHSDAVSALLAEKASVHIKDIYGASALSAAARNGHSKALQNLVNADPESLCSKDGFGHTPFWWITKFGTKKFIKLTTRLALDNGIAETKLESYNGPKRQTKYDEEQSWCDVCTQCVADCKTAVHCTVCCDDEFMICHECDSLGMKCLDAAHSVDKWERETGCFQCRLTSSIEKDASSESAHGDI